MSVLKSSDGAEGRGVNREEAALVTLATVPGMFLFLVVRVVSTIRAILTRVTWYRVFPYLVRRLLGPISRSGDANNDEVDLVVPSAV